MNLREDSLAVEIGIPRKQLAKIRKERLKKGFHFVKEVNCIVYTEQGVAALKKAFPDWIEKNPPTPEVIPEQEQVEGAVNSATEICAGKQIIELSVIQIPRNTRILICENNQIVHVRDNSNFTLGMRVNARDLGGRLELDGRLPRRKGQF